MGSTTRSLHVRFTAGAKSTAKVVGDALHTDAYVSEPANEWVTAIVDWPVTEGADELVPVAAQLSHRPDVRSALVCAMFQSDLLELWLYTRGEEHYYNSNSRYFHPNKRLALPSKAFIASLHGVCRPDCAVNDVERLLNPTNRAFTEADERLRAIAELLGIPAMRCSYTYQDFSSQKELIKALPVLPPMLKAVLEDQSHFHHMRRSRR